MDDKKNQATPIQPAGEHVDLDRKGLDTVRQSGGEVHHEAREAEQVAEKVASNAVVGQNASVDHSQFEAQGQNQQQQAATPQSGEKKSLLDVITDIFSLRWLKSNLRNKYGEDINKVRTTRESEKTSHLEKNPSQKYDPFQVNPRSSTVQSSPQSQGVSQAPQNTPSASPEQNTSQANGSQAGADVGNKNTTGQQVQQPTTPSSASAGVNSNTTSEDNKKS